MLGAILGRISTVQLSGKPSASVGFLLVVATDSGASAGGATAASSTPSPAVDFCLAVAAESCAGAEARAAAALDARKTGLLAAFGGSEN